MKLFVVAFVVGVAGASRARAQSVPFVSLDVTGGSGPASSHVNQVWFNSTRVGMTSADLALRLGEAGKTRAVLALGYSAATTSSINDLLCRAAPNGTCTEAFPYTSGASVGIGLRQTVGNAALVGATLGVASYTGAARYASLEATLRLGAHVGVTARYRHFNMPYKNGQVWFAPFMVGLSTTW